MSTAAMSTIPATAETQVTRVVTGVTGIAALVFLALSWSSVSAETRYLNPVWQAVAVIVVFCFPPLFVPFARRAGLPTLRRWLGAYAVVFTLAVLTFVPAITAGPIPVDLQPWPVLITAIGTVPAALAWRPALSWSWLVGNSLLIAPVRYFASGGGDLSVPLQYAFFTVTFAGIFSGITIIALNNGRVLDAAAAEARTVAASAAAAVAREHEQARLDALVHDEVISTLFGAAQANPAHAESLRRQARLAIDHLARLRETGVGEGDPVDPADFVRRMKSTVLGLSSDVDFEVRGSRRQPLPADVAATFAEATAEAVRNSLEHAGDAAQRWTTVQLAENGVRVFVADNGKGFDPRSVPAHRLGIAVSIRGRLETVSGGSATVASGATDGTRILLDWKQP